VPALTPSRARWFSRIAGAGALLRCFAVNGVGLAGDGIKNLKKVEECGVDVLVGKTTPPGGIANLTWTPLSYTSFVSIARSAMNKIYGVISYIESEAF